MALMAAVPGSPYQPLLPPGAGPSGPFAAIAGGVGFERIPSGDLPYAGLVLVLAAAASFLMVARAAWRGEVPLRSAVAAAVAANAAVAFLPLLFSHDVYSYISYGQIASLHHANPYVLTPHDFPGDAIFPLVSRKWVSTPAVYGPLFTLLSAWLTGAVHRIDVLVNAFRLVAIAASLSTIALIVHLAKRLAPERAAFAVVAFGLNPVVVFQSVASGHNDLLVALTIVGALALVLSGRELSAVGSLTLGALIKATAVLPLVLLVVWIVARRPAGSRARRFAACGAIVAGLGTACAAPFLQTQDPTLGMVGLAGHEGWLAPSRFVRAVFDAVSHHTLGVVARVGFAALLVVTMVALARRVAREAPSSTAASLAGTWGWALVSLMLLGPVLLPWYVTWTLPLVWLVPRVPRITLVGTAMALAISQWAAEPTRYWAAYNANVLVGHYLITPVVLALLVWFLIDLRRRLRTGAPLDDEPHDVPTHAGDH